MPMLFGLPRERTGTETEIDWMHGLVGAHCSSDGRLSSVSETTPTSDVEKQQRETVTDRFRNLKGLEKQASIETL